MANPTLPAIILGRKLLRLRLDAGMTQAQAAKQSRFSDSKLSDIENGKGRIRLFDVAGLCRIYGAPAELQHQLERMSDETENPGWWEPYSTYMLHDFAMFLELEECCSHIDIYESDLITGLLQTQEYARRVNSVVPALNDPETDEALALLAARQGRFWGRTPLPQVRIVLSEAALLRPEVDVEQRRRLLDVAGRSGATVAVVPLADGAHPSMKGPYTILTSGIPEVADTVYTETITGARYTTDADQISASRTFFEKTAQRSVPVKEYLNDTE